MNGHWLMLDENPPSFSENAMNWDRPKICRTGNRDCHIDDEVDGLVGEYGARDISPSDMDHFPQTMYN